MARTTLSLLAEVVSVATSTDHRTRMLWYLNMLRDFTGSTMVSTTRVSGLFHTVFASYSFLLLTNFAGGRAYPDVSAQALWFGFVWNNTVSTISGTSAS